MVSVRPFDFAKARLVKARGGVYVDEFCDRCGQGLVGRFGERSSRCASCKVAVQRSAQARSRARERRRARAWRGRLGA